MELKKNLVFNIFSTPLTNRKQKKSFFFKRKPHPPLWSKPKIILLWCFHLRLRLSLLVAGDEDQDLFLMSRSPSPSPSLAWCWCCQYHLWGGEKIGRGCGYCCHRRRWHCIFISFPFSEFDIPRPGYSPLPPGRIAWAIQHMLTFF